jgi:hypothetical protein
VYNVQSIPLSSVQPKFEAFRYPFVVRIKESNPFGSGVVDSGISCGLRATVMTVANQPDARIFSRKLSYSISAVVYRAVIDDNRLPESTRLPLNTSQRGFDRRSAVETGHDNSHQSVAHAVHSFAVRLLASGAASSRVIARVRNRLTGCPTSRFSCEFNDTMDRICIFGL